MSIIPTQKKSRIKPATTWRWDDDETKSRMVFLIVGMFLLTKPKKSVWVVGVPWTSGRLMCRILGSEAVSDAI